MKVVIVCAFDTYFDRVKLLKGYYKKEDVIVISSDFSHRKKKKIHNEMSDLDINVKEYKILYLTESQHSNILIIRLSII